MPLQDEIRVRWREMTAKVSGRTGHLSEPVEGARFSPGGLSTSLLERGCLGGLQSVGLST